MSKPTVKPILEPGPRIKTGQIIGGWIMFVVYTFLSGYISAGAQKLWEKLSGAPMGDKALLVFPYLLCFLLCVIIFRRHLARELRAFGKNFGHCILTGIIAYAAIYAMGIAVSLAMAASGVDLAANPNQNALYEMYDTSSQAVIASACLLGPLVEEVIFRSAIYGGIAKRSKVLAHIVSWLCFGSIHVIYFAITQQQPALLIYVLAYIPHSIGLNVLWERSGSAWACIFLHMIINATSVAAIGAM